MKKRIPVLFEITYLDGSHRSGDPVPFWRVDSHDGYLEASWIYHRPIDRDSIIRAMHEKIYLNILEDQRIAELLGILP